MQTLGGREKTTAATTANAHAGDGVVFVSRSYPTPTCALGTGVARTVVISIYAFATVDIGTSNVGAKSVPECKLSHRVGRTAPPAFHLHLLRLLLLLILLILKTAVAVPL